ncbi:MAG: hypothetical protein WKG00_13350 [Polyangiaceae bacterium]
MTEARSALRALRRLGRTALVAAALVACGGEDLGPRVPSGQDAASAVPLASGRIEVRAGGERPRLTLVTRDGDPYPALAVVAANDAGAPASAALAALVEARLTAAGFSVEARVDRNAFRMVWAAAPERMASFFTALSSAFARPVVAGAPELTAVGKRLASLRQAALDAPEAVPIAACTGRLGVLTSEPVPDASSARGAAEVEAMRRAWRTPAPCRWPAWGRRPSSAASISPGRRAPAGHAARLRSTPRRSPTAAACTSPPRSSDAPPGSAPRCAWAMVERRWRPPSDSAPPIRRSQHASARWAPAGSCAR